MSLALVRKEMREHGWVLGASFLFSMFILLGLLRLAHDRGGRFSGLRDFLVSVGLLNAFVAANRLIAREYAGRTQLFLEVLPIRRSRVFWTKWLLGLAFVGVTTGIAWRLNLGWQRRTEVITGQQAAVVLVQALCFSLVTWAFCAMAGVLGRYRYLASIGLVVVVASIGASTGIALHEFHVLSLLGPQFKMAQPVTSWSDAYQALALAGLFTGAAASLALLGSGGITSALAKRMTARERVFVLVAILAAITLVSALEDKHRKPAFVLAGAEHATSKFGQVGVLPTEDFSSEQARTLAAGIAQDVDSLASAMAIDAVGSIFVLPQQGVDRWVVEQASLAGSEGIVLRSSTEAPGDWLRANVLHSVVVEHTRGRAVREDRHVLLDGLVAWWASRGDSAARGRWWQRAAASPLRITEHTLRRWDETDEQVGSCIASGIAFATADVLTEKLGPKRTQELLQKLFERNDGDARVLFERSPAEVLTRAGTSWSSLARAAEAKRQAAKQQFVRELSSRPPLVGEFELSRVEGRGSSVRARLSGVASYWVTYALLDPWTTNVMTASRLDVRGAQATLPLSLPRSGRLFAAIEVEDPVLDCPVRVHSRRIALP